MRWKWAFLEVEVAGLILRSRIFEWDLEETSFRFGIRWVWRLFLEFLVTSDDSQRRGARRSMVEGCRILGFSQFSFECLDEHFRERGREFWV